MKSICNKVTSNQLPEEPKGRVAIHFSWQTLATEWPGIQGFDCKFHLGVCLKMGDLITLNLWPVYGENVTIKIWGDIPMGNRLRNTSCTLSSGSAWVHPRPPPAPRKRSLREHQGTTRGCSFFILILIIIIFFFFIIIITIFFIITVHHNGHILSSSSSSSSSSLSWCQHVVKSAAVATTMQRPLMRGLILDMVDLNGDGPSWKSETTPQTPNSFCSVCALAIFDPCQVSTAWITSNIFSCHGVSIFWDAMCILSETIRGRQGWETSGEMQKKKCGTWFYISSNNKKTQRDWKNRDKHETQIKTWWRHMIGERQLMEDTQMRTGERAGHHHKSKLMIGNKSKRETDKWETPCERHMMRDKWKQKKIHPRAGHY